jgi:NhaP-type Na+/H+ or K+/H+ antiporter
MLTETQLTNKFPIFYGILGVITLVTKSLPILSQINQVHNFISDFFKISFIIILLYKLGVSNDVFP